MATALRVLIQTLERIESLHEAGYISRDVKAPNFAIGVDNQTAVVYMLDYGFARKYVWVKRPRNFQKIPKID